MRRRICRRSRVLGLDGSAGLDDERLLPLAADDAAAERVYLLRRAALMDRMAVDDPGPGARGAAVKAAYHLAEFDRQHPEMVAGPHGPTSPEFDRSQRPYVRQEYAAWTAAGQPD
ncbi:hypothetical protein ACFW2D_17890 [Streptomyces sp. NPDC058914]|uniref:hypothetical protein n=1 Tax=Streptomyces sp. NPDC058914 TaxID=3346671 RepID=UPI0036851771